ncbi:MAG: hypothetical protein JWQ71_4342 [Pedosphaera sp.]|nr:hypothetical protein [Pedosphaera sp.]
MLYTAYMNDKLNVPDEIWLGKKDYSFRTDFTVNRWMFVALVLSALSDVFFPHQISQWPATLRAVVALAPFLAILFWIRSVRRWIGGMDELHRRITVAACLFATIATFFAVTAWQTLDKTGVWQSIYQITHLHLGLNPADLWLILSQVTFFYFLGYAHFNRRYQ